MVQVLDVDHAGRRGRTQILDAVGEGAALEGAAAGRREVLAERRLELALGRRQRAGGDGSRDGDGGEGRRRRVGGGDERARRAVLVHASAIGVVQGSRWRMSVG